MAFGIGGIASIAGLGAGLLSDNSVNMEMSPQQKLYFERLFPHQADLWTTAQGVYTAQPGLAPGAQDWLNNLQGDYWQAWQNLYGPGSSTNPLGMANNLANALNEGNFDLNRGVNPSFNTFRGGAGTSTYGANVQDPSQFNITAAQAAGNFDPVRAAMANADPALMEAARNMGFTPSDLVSGFMSGGAYQNPFLDRMADAALRRYNQNYEESTMPSLRSGASSGSGASGYGSNRRYIAEGMAAREHDQGASDLLANLYGSAYDRGFDVMGNLAGTTLSGDINRATQNANLIQAANLANAGFGQQANLQNASNALQNNQWNAAAANNMRLAGNQFNLSNAGLVQDASLANQRAQYGTQAANQAGINAANAQNTQQQNMQNRFNTQLGFDQQTINANIANQIGLNNAALQQQDVQQNLRNRLLATDLPVAGLGNMLQTGMPLFGLYDMPSQQAWGQLRNWSGIMQPYAGEPDEGVAYSGTSLANNLGTGVNLAGSIYDTGSNLGWWG